jgi:hypothetical protein
MWLQRISGFRMAALHEKRNIGAKPLILFESSRWPRQVAVSNWS